MYEKKLKQYRFNLAAILLFVITFFVLGLLSTDNIKSLKISFIGVLVFIYLSVDYILILKIKGILDDRQAFAKNLLDKSKLTFLFISVMLLVIYFVQYILTYEFLTLDEVMFHYGIVYRKVINGEYWRLFIGIFFHSGLVHWSINAAMLLGIGTLASTGSKYFAIFIFYFGCVFSALTALVISTSGLSTDDGFLGISGGISSLSGYFLYYSSRNKSNYPSFFYISFGMFVLTLTAVDFMMAPITTAACHFSGFIFGYIVSISLYDKLLVRPTIS